MAWDLFQANELAIDEACSTAITSENCLRSLAEWCVGHKLLMKAVQLGKIPASRHYKGNSVHWQVVLFQHCAKLAIERKDVNFVLSLFKQAENVGVIALGTMEGFVDIVGVREDIEENKRFTSTSIYQLFVRQLEMNNRLRLVLHYQHVQQLTAMVNAVLGFIPIAGVVLINALTGGVTILNDLQICGLVESLLGVGKDMSEYVTGRYVDRLVGNFLVRCNKILDEEEWLKLFPEKRKVIEDGASSMGLAVGELRAKLKEAMLMEGDYGSGINLLLEENLASPALDCEDEKLDVQGTAR